MDYATYLWSRGMRFVVCLAYKKRTAPQYVLCKGLKFKPFKNVSNEEIIVFPNHETAMKFLSLIEDPDPLLCLSPL